MTPGDLAYNHPRHPGWLRVWLYAMDHDGEDLNPGELRDATDLDARTLSRSLKTARKIHLLSEDSHARHLTVRHLPLGASLSEQVPHAS